MKVVVQRVTKAQVSVNGTVVSSMQRGLLCLVGIHQHDTEKDAEYIARKILNMRMWASEKKTWDLSVMQKDFDVMCVSQFTLHSRLSGNKLDFSKAMGPVEAKTFYESFLERLKKEYRSEKIHDGVFGAMMDVELTNDGPVTLTIDSFDR